MANQKAHTKRAITSAVYVHILSRNIIEIYATVDTKCVKAAKLTLGQTILLCPFDLETVLFLAHECDNTGLNRTVRTYFDEFKKTKNSVCLNAVVEKSVFITASPVTLKR